MKTTRLSLLSVLTLVLFATSCQKDAHSADRNAAQNLAVTAPVITSTGNILTGKGASGPCNPNAYTITLESRTQVNGNWEWVWSVQNPSPGNGNNGTVQNLSHWGMQFGACFTWTSVVSAAYSADGATWNGFTPQFQSDPSQSCMTTPVLKFDFGTNGSAKSYYKLVVNRDYQAVPTPGYYKSGANTGCCTFTFSGMGCGDDGDIR
jgi:hypothetical protein